MLPSATDTTFPAALKAAREAKGMSRTALAKAAGIHAVMPRRYEEPTGRDFAKPTASTWLALNKALAIMPTDTTAPAESKSTLSLCDASTDDIVAELRGRGIAVTLTFPA